MIAQFDANSLLGHIHLVKAQLPTHFYHIISVSETWLHSQISDDLIQLDDYLLIRNDREGKRGGGVACYVHKSLQVRVLAASPSSFSNAPEYIILELMCQNANAMLFTTMYRRPKGLFLGDFFAVLLRFSFAYSNIIISGDSNCNLCSSNFEATLLRELTSSRALSIVASGPTHHTTSADSWLDVFIVNSPDKIVSFWKSNVPFIAGHDLLELTHQFETEPNPARMISRRNYKRFDASSFLSSLDFSRLVTLDSCSATGANVDVFFNSVCETIMTALDVQAPM